MKTFKIIALLLFTSFSMALRAQQMPVEIVTALKQDDTLKLSPLLTANNINTCYGYYSILSNAIRSDAMKCFTLLIKSGADVNKRCNGYLPPLMHAVKYGNLDMVKILVAKGADINYNYDGELKLTNGPEKGDTPLTYAEKYQRAEIQYYLRNAEKRGR